MRGSLAHGEDLVPTHRVADIGKPVRDFWGRRTHWQKNGLVAGLVFIGLGISTYVGDPFGLGAVVTLSNGG